MFFFFFKVSFNASRAGHGDASDEPLLCGHLPRATNPRTGGRPTRALAGTNPSTGRPPYPFNFARLFRLCIAFEGSLAEVAYAAGSVLLFFFLIGRVLFLEQLCPRFCLGLIQCDEFSGAVHKSHLTSPPGMGSTWFLFFRDQCKWQLIKRLERHIHVVCSQTLVRGVRRAILQVPRVFRSGSLLLSLGVSRERTSAWRKAPYLLTWFATLAFALRECRHAPRAVYVPGIWHVAHP